MSSYYDDVSDSDEEEEECRVCRGPAEEGRPLFKPCKCSGSIGLTHQDCLTSWLDVTRGDGRCELCSTRFEFAPQYAEGTPDRLSPSEVCFRILRRLGAKWIPRGLRAVLAACLWLVVLPLSTSYIYHGWMHRPSAIAERWSWDLAKRDTVGGAVIAIIIIVSFLSLMSFAEFLRFQWGGGAQQQQQQRQRAAGNRANREGAGAAGAPIEGEIDDIIVHRHDDDEDDSDVDPLEPFINHMMMKDEGSVDDDSDSDSDGAVVGDANNALGINEVQIPMDGLGNAHGHDGLDNDEDADAVDQHQHLPPVYENEEDELEAFMRAQEEAEREDDEHRRRAEADDDRAAGLPGDGRPEPEDAIPNPVPPPPLQQQRAGNAPNARPRDDARFEPQFEPLQPAFDGLDAQDDGGEVEINVALDELLGFRGPFVALIRNLLWLLVFNMAYLGVFAFAPSRFGGSMYLILLRLSASDSIRKWLPDSSGGVGKLWDKIMTSMKELDKKSRETNLIYQPSQIAKMGLGYVSFSILIFLLKAIVSALVTRRRAAAEATASPREAQNNDRIRDGRVHFGEEDFREGMALLNEVERARADRNNRNRDQDVPGKKLLGMLECAGAIAKVVILLFIKMLLLPLMLGIWLDLATLSLFEKTWNDRIEYAGTDLFGSIFLHWVTGITFMLLVTVSVLQLREVAHPDILARMIRPQEPQPDLLGNLLQESGATHTKRVLLSLGIYAALLAVHIWLPSRILLAYDLGKHLPLFQPKFWHVIMPQIQVPVELFIFHLCMLGVLEKYKNNIGECQHHWLLMMSEFLGMTDQILPREVGQFSLLGTLPVFSEDASLGQLERLDSIRLDELPSLEGRNDDVYPLWNYLLSESDQSKREDLIQASISKMDAPESPRHENGVIRRDGKKLLSSHAYIRLPSASSTSRLVVKTSDGASSNLLPTVIGPYRLKQGRSKRGNAKVTNIEIWREVVGKPIPRPPEGWDDLGVGGAERHGRWAWGDEQTSEIENSVAVRTPFFKDPNATKWAKALTLAQLSGKLIFLLFVSWVAISAALCSLLNFPLEAGHFAMHLLRIPEDCVHDPLAYAIGLLLLVPVASIVAKLYEASDNGSRGVFSLLLEWARSFKPHHTGEKVKTLSVFFALWLIVCPALLGFLYCNFFVGISSDAPHWLARLDTAFVNWGTGTMLLNLWAIMCYFEMFTKQFWSDLIFGEHQGNNANENQDDPGARQGGANNDAPNAGLQANGAQGTATDANEPQEFTWQGRDGAIARAMESMKAVLSGWEWDKVDKQSLLFDCAFPVAQHLAVSCAVPLSAVAFVTPLFTAGGRQLGATAIFRIFAIVSITVDSINSSKQSLNRWFQAAHKIARDDRYLIGEILLNYSPQQTST